MGKLVEMLGLKFGRLTVVGRVANQGTRAAWSCRCQCGTKIIVDGKKLRSGHTASCGCLRSEISAPANARGRIMSGAKNIIDRLHSRHMHLVGEYKGTKETHEIECDLCQHKWPGELSRYLYVHRCPRCSRSDNGFINSEFLKKNSHLVDAPTYLYVVKCVGDGEVFYKVGLTRQPLHERFRKIPYAVELLGVRQGGLADIAKIERDTKRAMKGSRYRPLKTFNGAAECFSLPPELGA